TNLNIEVTATDRASSVVRDVKSDVESLEGEHEVEIVAEDQTTDELAHIRSKLDALTDKDRTIALKAEASRLESEVSKAERVLKNLDKYDGDEIRIKLEARDNATKKLDAVRDEMRQLDGDTVTVKVEAKADDVSQAAGAGGLDSGLAAGLAAKAGPAAIAA